MLLVIIIFSGLLLNIQNNRHTPSSELMVEVRISGKIVERITKNGVYPIFPIFSNTGQRITTLHFEGRYVWVEGSTCPDKICEKTGKVSEGGSIICVPNKMIIEVKGRKDTLRYDVQTW
uniref:NusG domain II-containing protein n=1 Tax=Fervidobacterium thailandense TaxID=1008305 RepID=A0A7C4VUW7_9BACT